jgi:CHAD domain
VKPRKVPKLSPDATLVDAVRRIATVRARELESFVPHALDPGEAKAQHDMRIAAKRLRYLLELAAPALGEPAADGAKAAKRLQTVLGEIHDCDEMLERTHRHVERLRGEDAEALRHAAGGARDLAPAVARGAPNRARYRGLESLASYLTARRAVLFERFVRDWESLDREGFATQLVEALSRPVVSADAQAPAARADGADS